jgi:hypothetical protein
MSGRAANVRRPSSSRPFGTRYVSGTPSTSSLEQRELARDDRDQVARVRLAHLPVENAGFLVLL